MSAHSAKCSHLGAHLRHGTVVGDRIRCALHHRECDDSGICQALPGGTVTAGMPCQRSYPVVEKYGAAFVGGVVREALARYGIGAQFAMLVPVSGEQGSGYLLLLETEREIPSGIDTALDRALRANPHCDYCVNLGQLLPAAIRRVPANAYQRFVGHLTARNQRLGDIKPRALSSLEDWGDVFGPSGRH